MGDSQCAAAKVPIPPIDRDFAPFKTDFSPIIEVKEWIFTQRHDTAFLSFLPDKIAALAFQNWFLSWRAWPTHSDAFLMTELFAVSCPA